MLQNVVDVIKSKQTGSDTGNETFALLAAQTSKTATKSCWHNFLKQAEALDREQPHILAYFLSELGCDGVIGNNGEMILTGGYQAKDFSKTIRRYANDYVKCIDCNSYQTRIKHEKKERIDYLICKKCEASRTVEPINVRFVATKRGQRRKDRQ
jgi:translation initiation factor 2 beta subunit (eIF-2beta)/eIF-5